MMKGRQAPACHNPLLCYQWTCFTSAGAFIIHFSLTSSPHYLITSSLYLPATPLARTTTWWWVGIDKIQHYN